MSCNVSCIFCSLFCCEQSITKIRWRRHFASETKIDWCRCRNIFTPLVVAFDLAMVSTMCDNLVEELNAKSVEDIANQKIVAPLVETLLLVNQGQGLGVSLFSRNTVAYTIAAVGVAKRP